MASIREFLGGLTRRQCLALAAVTGASLIWQRMLPEFMGVSAWIEGPLPAIAGATLGLRLTRAEDLPLQILGTCAAAFAGSLAAVMVLGLGFYGPLEMLAGVFGLLRATFHLPTTSIARSWGTEFGMWGLWAALKTLLNWGALGFAVLFYRRHGSAWLTILLRGFGDRRLVATDRRQRLREYYRDYAAAIRRGDEPPTPPVILPALGEAGVGHYAQLSFWGLRVALTLAGALGFYATFGDLLAGNVGAIFWRGLMGG